MMSKLLGCIYMKLRLFLIPLTLMIASLAACGGGSTPADGGVDESDLADDDWRAISNSADILFGLKFAGAAGALTIINNSASAIGAPALTTYDPSSWEAVSIAVSGAADIAAGGAAELSFTFPGDAAPAASALTSLSLGGSEAAIFVTAAAYAALSPAILDPSVGAGLSFTASPYATPNSGTWNFQMSLGTEYLSGTNCPSSPLGMTSSGETTLYISNSGYSAVWMADGNVVTFNRSASSGDFESPSYTFPVATDDGTVYGTNRWVLAPLSQTSISGTLVWDNSLGCSANYPITMNFVSAANPSTINLCEGAWSISYGPIACGANVVSPAALPGLPYPSGTLDVSYAADVPIALTFDSLSSYQALPNIGGTNTYGSGFPNMTLGPTVDFLGAPLVIVGGFQMTALSSTQIVGVMNVMGFGPNACAGATAFTMTPVSGC